MKKENKILVGILIIALLTGCIDKTELNNETNEDNKYSCEADSDCVSEQCCHPTSCINKNLAPNCQGISCTEECKKGSMDCGCGHCACVNHKCTVNWTREQEWCGASSL